MGQKRLPDVGSLEKISGYGIYRTYIMCPRPAREMTMLRRCGSSLLLHVITLSRVEDTSTN